MRNFKDTRDKDIHDQSPTFLGWPFFVRNVLDASKVSFDQNSGAQDADLQQHDCN